MPTRFCPALLLLAACAHPPPPPDVDPPGVEQVRADARCPESAAPGFDPEQVRREVTCHVGLRLGRAAVEQMLAADTALSVTYHQGLPKPVQRSDGSWGWEGPMANALIRTAAGWHGWKAGAPQPVGPAAVAEIERILADPAFWREPDYARPSCTDAGARRLVIRHGALRTIRQQGCGGVGLTGRLFDLVLAGA